MYRLQVFKSGLTRSIMTGRSQTRYLTRQQMKDLFTLKEHERSESKAIFDAELRRVGDPEEQQRASDLKLDQFLQAVEQHIQSLSAVSVAQYHAGFTHHDKLHVLADTDLEAVQDSIRRMQVCDDDKPGNMGSRGHINLEGVGMDHTTVDEGSDHDTPTAYDDERASIDPYHRHTDVQFDSASVGGVSPSHSPDLLDGTSNRDAFREPVRGRPSAHSNSDADSDADSEADFHSPDASPASHTSPSVGRAVGPACAPAPIAPAAAPGKGSTAATIVAGIRRWLLGAREPESPAVPDSPIAGRKDSPALSNYASPVSHLEPAAAHVRGDEASPGVDSPYSTACISPANEQENSSTLNKLDFEAVFGLLEDGIRCEHAEAMDSALGLYVDARKQIASIGDEPAGCTSTPERLLSLWCDMLGIARSKIGPQVTLLDFSDLVAMNCAHRVGLLVPPGEERHDAEDAENDRSIKPSLLSEPTTTLRTTAHLDSSHRYL